VLELTSTLKTVRFLLTSHFMNGLLVQAIARNTRYLASVLQRQIVQKRKWQMVCMLGQIRLWDSCQQLTPRLTADFPHQSQRLAEQPALIDPPVLNTGRAPARLIDNNHRRGAWMQQTYWLTAGVLLHRSCI
jgi:hypothetical protein